MRVLVISNLYPPESLGGYELGCAQMVQALGERGHDVRVVTSVSAGASDDAKNSIDRVLGMPPIYNRDRMQSASPSLNQHFQVLVSAINPANARMLGQIIEEFQPDVAYIWNLLGLGGLGIVAQLEYQGIRWVWHIMDDVPRTMCGFATSGPELARELSRVFPGRYVCCSSHILGEIRVGEVDLGDQVYVIPNWVSGEPPSPRSEFFAGGHLRLLSASGTLCEAKGTDILIESAVRLRDQGYGNFTIDLYGHEVDQRFRAMLVEHDVTHSVRLMGRRPHDELLDLYGSYDVFAFPTWSREPFAFAPLEAAAAGCVPLFTSDCGNAEWMIDEVDCLKAPRNVSGFAERIASILRGEVDLAAVARRGQSVVWRDFHLSRAALQVELLLEDSATERRPARSGPSHFLRLARFAEGLIQTLMEES